MDGSPPSLGFSRQEHWSGLPFPSPVHESEVGGIAANSIIERVIFFFVFCLGFVKGSGFSVKFDQEEVVILRTAGFDKFMTEKIINCLIRDFVFLAIC